MIHAHVKDKFGNTIYKSNKINKDLTIYHEKEEYKNGWVDTKTGIIVDINERALEKVRKRNKNTDKQ